MIDDKFIVHKTYSIFPCPTITTAYPAPRPTPCDERGLTIDIASFIGPYVLRVKPLVRCRSRLKYYSSISLDL